MGELSYSAPRHTSMIWAVAFWLPSAFCSAQAADGPQFSAGGFQLSAQYGAGFWLLDSPKLSAQVGAGEASLFTSDVSNTHTVAFRASYTIRGHASVLADVTGTGWRLSETTRGGAGFLCGGVAWHPLELVWHHKPQRPVPLDVSASFGVGYGIAGQRRGMDGLVFQLGLDVSYYFTRYFGLSAVLRNTFLGWRSFYVDYNNRDQPGSTLALSEGSGGSFLHVGVSLVFRAGE